MLCITEKGYFRTRSAFSEDITPRRRVGSFEVEIVATGTGFSYIDGVRYSHVPNRLIFAKPGSQRFTIGAYECDYLKFTCDEEASALLRTLPDSAILTDPTVKGAMEAICSRETPGRGVTLYPKGPGRLRLPCSAAHRVTRPLPPGPRKYRPG